MTCRDRQTDRVGWFWRTALFGAALSRKSRSLPWFGLASVGMGAAWAMGLACTPARASAPTEAAAPAEECCAFDAAGANPEGFWVTTLLPGQIYDFDLMPGSPLPAGGQWAAEFGSVDADGTYRSPAFAPPSGIDSLRYEAPNGVVATVWIRLEESPGNEFEPPYVVPDGFHAQSEYMSPERPNPSGERRNANVSNPMPSKELRESWARTQWAQRGWLDTVPKDGQWHPIRKSTEPPGPDLAPVTDCAEIVAVESGALLPVSTYLGSNERLDLLAIQSGSPGIQQKDPLRCKTGPINPVPDWNDNPCSPPGTNRRIDGPVKRFKKYLGFNPNAGSIRATAKIRADLIRLFSVDVEVGTEMRFGRHTWLYREFQTFDFYKCVNGRWTYDGTKVCERDSTGSRTDPEGANFIFGSPINGDPNGWSSWICNPIP